MKLGFYSTMNVDNEVIYSFFFFFFFFFFVFFFFSSSSFSSSSSTFFFFFFFLFFFFFFFSSSSSFSSSSTFFIIIFFFFFFFFFFFYWRYNPLWVVAFLVIFFHSALSLHNFPHPLIPIICISSSMSSIHLFLGLLLFLLPVGFHSNNVMEFAFNS